MLVVTVCQRIGSAVSFIDWKVDEQKGWMTDPSVIAA